MKRSAIFSEDRVYRYFLEREWKPKLATAVFVGLNPSTADENFDDPTINRCMRFVNDWGYGRLLMVNLFAFCARSPKELKLFRGDPIGKLNDKYIKDAQIEANLVVACWGFYGDLFGRGEEVLHRLNAPYHFGLTKNKQPKHPLYLKKSTGCEPYPSMSIEKAGKAENKIFYQANI